MKSFYKQFTVSHDPLNTAVSSAEILRWFNKQLVHYGARWQAKRRQWRSVKTRLDLDNIRWEKIQVTAVNNKPSIPLASLQRVKRRLYEPTPTAPQLLSRKLFEL